MGARHDAVHDLVRGGSKISPQVRAILRSFPEVTVVTSELGRPDDGTRPTGFFNDEFFVGLKPYRPMDGRDHTKAQLIEAIDEKLKAFPGIIFNFTQPAEDAVDEAETGLKSSLAVKIFGPDLTVLEDRGKCDQSGARKRCAASREISVIRQLGQPSLTVTSTARRSRDTASTSPTSTASSKRRSAARPRRRSFRASEASTSWCVSSREFRQTPEAIRNILVATPGGQQVPLKELADVREVSGASFIYREDNSRYIGVQYSIKDRDLAGAVEDAQRQVAKAVQVPTGYRVVWGGEYENYTASKKQLQIIVPVTLLVIFMLLFMLYSNFKFPMITVAAVLISGPIGGLLALYLTHTPFSVSSGIGFIALFGVSVQTAVIFISYANELRQRGLGIAEATREAAILRLRPIMMTALVAALGLLPAALSTGIGSDTQKPFALVIVGGLLFETIDQRLPDARALRTRRQTARPAGGVITRRHARREGAEVAGHTSLLSFASSRLRVSGFAWLRVITTATTPDPPPPAGVGRCCLRR